jgi:dihydroorotate dehydrogenase (NAD+) catalytic subunit
MIRITRPGKQGITLENPVMNAAGILGWGDAYRDVIDWSKLGAFVTNPVSLAMRSPANGTRVVPLDAGMLVHTGLPNLGLSKTIDTYRPAWERLPIPVILHLIATTPDEIMRCMERIESEDIIAGVELGLDDDIAVPEAVALVRAACERWEKPVLVRLPFGEKHDFARAMIGAGAGGLVLCAAPRGTARDAAGRLVPGRLYGTWIKPLVLRQVGQMARELNAPIVAAGGIHSPQDARDFLEAGANAIQVDSAVWIRPEILNLIASDLGGMTVTQPSGALADEWHTGMTDTERASKAGELPTKEDRKKK